MYLATKYCMGSGVGVSNMRLPSFDKALLNAGIGNYNLVRLSSILPAHCRFVEVSQIRDHIKEGSLLPTAYATISSETLGEKIVSAIGVGFPENEEDVGVIMEFSAKGLGRYDALAVLDSMVEEAFDVRGWKLKDIRSKAAEAVVLFPNTVYTTFAFVSEW